MLKLTNVPIEIYWRALDLYGVPRETTVAACVEALRSAEATLEVKPELPGIAPFAQAIAEYMSLSGPFAEEGGEFAGVNGYETRAA
jgi:hypothetical protein